ncbi:MAG: hypothetical protein AAFX44_06785 [Pseudomonadota bacterium]
MIQVTSTDIASLDSRQLQELLNRLLHQEARKFGLSAAGINATDPARITVPDGGDDGTIEWGGGIECTAYLRKRNNLFQVKAEKWPRKKCHKEVLKKDSKELQPAIKEVLEAGGSYTIFSTDHAEGQALRERVAGLLDGLREGKYSDPENADVDFYNANKIRDWVNEYVSVALWVHQILGRPYHGFQTVEQWEGNHEIHSTAFVEDDELREKVKQLRNLIQGPRTVTRLVGQSGTGKTRLAFEACRKNPSESDEEHPSDRSLDGVSSIPTSVIYTNIINDDCSELVRLLRALRDESKSLIVVVDDCSEEIHEQLAKIVQHADSEISLLTIDYEVSTNCSGVPVTIDGVSDDVVGRILGQHSPDLTTTDRDRIVEFSQGYPQMAVLLAEARISNQPEMGPLSRDEILRKMVWGRGSPDETSIRILEVCSLFRRLGVSDNVKDQRTYAAKIAGVTDDKFHRVLKHFESRKIVQRRGRFIQVQPIPLALRLASDWWRSTPEETATRIFKDDLPPGMVEAVCEQLRMLDFVVEAREIAASLCGEHGPFGKAEVLNTERGSECFRSLSETNPAAAMGALTRVYSNCSTQQLLEVGPGRRNIIFALEKLVFRDALFTDAARLLLSFAAAENETWGNNATGQFLQLFQMYLAGTEAGSEKRFQIIEEALESSDSEFVHLGVKALDRTLRTSGYTRSGGAESQGSGEPLRDWQPSSREEQVGYLQTGLSRLSELAITEHFEHAEEAQNSIAVAARGLVLAGMWTDVQSAFLKIVEFNSGYWPKGLDSLAEILRFDREGMEDGQLAEIKSLMDEMFPADLGSQIRLIVSELDSGLFHDGESDDYWDEGPKQAEQLAEAARDQIQLVCELVPELSRGRQANAVAFGRRLGEVILDPSRVVDVALAELQKNDDANPSFLSSFLGGLQRQGTYDVDSLLDRVADTPSLVKYLVDLSVGLAIAPKDLKRIIRALQENKIDVQAVRFLSYGRLLEGIDAGLLCDLVSALIKRDPAGHWVAIDLLGMVEHGKLVDPNRIRQAEMNVITSRNLMIDTPVSDQSLDRHHYQQLAIKLIRDPNYGKEAAVELASHIVEAASRSRFEYAWNSPIQKLLIEIFGKYPAEGWPVIGNAVITADRMTKFHFEHILGSRHGARSENGPMSHLPLEIVMEWCRETDDKGPTFVISSAKLFQESNGEKVWSELVVAILDEFGSSELVTSSLSQNMHTFSWSGSLVPMYEEMLKAVEQLKNHKHKNVRQWVKRERKSLLSQISSEKDRDAEQEFGVY